MCCAYFCHASSLSLFAALWLLFQRLQPKLSCPVIASLSSDDLQILRSAADTYFLGCARRCSILKHQQQSSSVRLPEFSPIPWHRKRWRLRRKQSTVKVACAFCIVVMLRLHSPPWYALAAGATVQPCRQITCVTGIRIPPSHSRSGSCYSPQTLHSAFLGGATVVLP